MTINVRVRDGMCPDPTTGEGGATEGDIRGSFSDIIGVIGVKDLAGGHLLVTQNSPAAMSVLVAPGVVYIPNANYDELDSNQVKFWEAVITVSTAVTITANTSGSTRIDLICAKMDTAITPDEHASNIATLVAVAGTPGAGVPATPDNHIKLAEIAVANGAATIITGNITDRRVQSSFDYKYLGSIAKTTPVDADFIPITDTADSNILKRLSWANIKATLLTWLKLGTTIFPHNAPRGYLINGKIVPSVASNNLTVAIKGLDGNDPSATNPVYCRIGDTIRAITSALSVTKNAGTNWFNAGSSELATFGIDYFVYLGYNTTDGVVIGFSRIPWGKEYSDFSTTSSNEKYCAISTITNATSGDDYELVGRFAATLSAGAGYTWTVPTFTNINLIQRPIYNTRVLTYAPVLTNVTVGSGTKVGKYQIFDSKIEFYLSFTLAADSAITNYIQVSLPIAQINQNSFQSIATDAGTGYVDCRGVYENTTAVVIKAPYPNATYLSFANTSSTVPFTWTTSDSFRIFGSYLLA